MVFVFIQTERHKLARWYRIGMVSYGVQIPMIVGIMFALVIFQSHRGIGSAFRFFRVSIYSIVHAHLSGQDYTGAGPANVAWTTLAKNLFPI